jgi:hypothetical protein
MSEAEQRADFVEKQAHANKDKRIRELEALVARHERANGALVAELHAAREALADMRLQHQPLPAADEHEPSVSDVAEAAEVVDTERPTADQCIAHMRRGGIIEINAYHLKGQRCIVDGEILARETPTDDWGPVRFSGLNNEPGFYRLLPIEGGAP